MIGLVEAYDYYVDVKERSLAAGTLWSNVLSTRTFINLQKWKPRAYIQRISPKPLLYVVATQDKFIPPQAQLETYLTCTHITAMQYAVVVERACF